MGDLTARNRRAAVPAARNAQQFAMTELGNEIMLFDEERMEFHTLNAAADAVWRLCDGVRSRDEIARTLNCEVGAVDLAVDELALAGLLEVDRDDWDRRVARRGLLKLAAGGLLGGAVLPAVTSITAPMSASADSPGCVPYGEQCFGTAPCCPFPGRQIGCVGSTEFAFCQFTD